MLFHFDIEFESKPGEFLILKFIEKKHLEPTEVNLVYKDLFHWEVVINKEDYDLSKKFLYEIFLYSEHFPLHGKQIVCSSISLKKIAIENLIIKHTGLNISTYPKLYNTKPFKKVFKKNNKKSFPNSSIKKSTHIFKVDHPILQKNKFICLTGSAEKMNCFNIQQPLIFKAKKSNKSFIRLDLSKEIFPIEYKIGIYDSVQKTIVEYGAGENIVLHNITTNTDLYEINHHNIFDKYLWRGAGINIPVFSIKTAKSWGSGDFEDLHLLVDYANSVDIKMIQLLPVNDTTSTLFDKDSYPYSAISSFALHPKLLSVHNIAVLFGTEIFEEERTEILRLNKLSYCDHGAVMNLKFKILRRIFAVNKNEFIIDKGYLSFVNKNKDWLIPYAIFCVLRDIYATLDYKTWDEFSEYTEEKMTAFIQHEHEHNDKVIFWCFIQYHLHVQLKSAAAYAHKNGVILKADLPIGVGRYSVDTWVNPNLFNINMQAGAPPDAFSTLGQNWSFPTYNTAQMSADNFAWFKKRMQQLEKYFDAVRIDHVLGMFRIWSIPANQINGTMGIFVPAIPLFIDDFVSAGLQFNYTRLCSPHITENNLLILFGADIAEIKEIFFDGYCFKNELNDQQKISKYFVEFPASIKYKQSLFDLIANVILFSDKMNENGYHFRINISQTNSYSDLPESEKNILNNLYTTYFYTLQNELWKKEGIVKLKMLKSATSMLLCAEDLGMVPDFTEEVLHSLDIISLQVQQMPKDLHTIFSDTVSSDYESVVMPSTHDMPPIRLWWEQNRELSQLFFNTILQESGAAPYFCEPWICKKIIEEHLQSPAMWSVFLMQDLLAIDGRIRRANPNEERINDPANANNVWSYRMHITVEDLMLREEFNQSIKNLIQISGR